MKISWTIEKADAIMWTSALIGYIYVAIIFLWSFRIINAIYLIYGIPILIIAVIGFYIANCGLDKAFDNFC